MFIHHTGYFCAPIRPLLSCSFTFQCPHSASRELFHIQPQATFTHKLLSKFRLFSLLPRFAMFAVKLSIFMQKNPPSKTTTDKHFADRVNFNIIGEEAVYLEWQLCLRGSEGSTAQLLIMDIRPRNWRPKFTSPTRLLAPILSHVVHKSWVSWRVYKCDSLNASHTLGNRSHHLCIIDIAPFYLPSCVSFPWKLRSYIHDGMKISN